MTDPGIFKVHFTHFFIHSLTLSTYITKFLTNLHYLHTYYTHCSQLFRHIQIEKPNSHTTADGMHDV